DDDSAQQPAADERRPRPARPRLSDLLRRTGDAAADSRTAAVPFRDHRDGPEPAAGLPTEPATLSQGRGDARDRGGQERPRRQAYRTGPGADRRLDSPSRLDATGRSDGA